MKTQGKGILIGALAFSLISLGTISTLGAEIDLTRNNDTTLYTVGSAVGGNGLVQNFTGHPTGTGVFDPFLTVQRAGGTTTEQGYNTAGHIAMYMDQQRPTWNTLLRLSDLATLTVAGRSYYGFELDANEPNNGRRNILIDEIQIFTSAVDNTALVGNNLGSLGLLGTLRWNMNDTINLNASVDVANGGSGFSDMLLYVPVDAFTGAAANDFLWFYNRNGNADYLSADAGFEEWRAVRGTSVPDPSSTLLLLGIALTGCGVLSRRLGRK